MERGSETTPIMALGLDTDTFQLDRRFSSIRWDQDMDLGDSVIIVGGIHADRLHGH